MTQLGIPATEFEAMHEARIRELSQQLGPCWRGQRAAPGSGRHGRGKKPRPVIATGETVRNFASVRACADALGVSAYVVWWSMRHERRLKGMKVEFALLASAGKGAKS